MITNCALKQVLLRILAGALVLSALVAIYVFLFGDFGDTEAKILVTTLSVSFFSVTSLGCAAAQDKKKCLYLATPGVVTGLVGFVLFLPLIWAEWWDSEAYSKAMGILALFAFSFAQACLLSLTSLEGRFKWVFSVAVVCIFSLAMFLSGMIVFEADDEWLIRVVGVIGILDGCASLSVPVLSKLGRKQSDRVADQPYQHVELVCPRCRHQSVYPIGEIECTNCSLKMKVEIYEGSSEPGRAENEFQKSAAIT